MRTVIALLITAVLSVPLAAQEADLEKRANHYLDHVVLGINNLDAGIQAFEQLAGVTPKKDGRDTQLGTESAIVGLGENMFLEIIAPDPKADPDSLDPDLRDFIYDRLKSMNELTPFKWAVGTSNLERTSFFARRAGSRATDIMEGSRKRGWGRKEQWTWFSVRLPESSVMPIFVQWKNEEKRPQDRAPEGCSLEALHAYSRSFKSVHALAATMQVDIDVEGEEVESITLTMDCPAGEVVLGPKPLSGDPNIRQR